MKSYYYSSPTEGFSARACNTSLPPQNQVCLDTTVLGYIVKSKFFSEEQKKVSKILSTLCSL